MSKQLGFYVNIASCTGCKDCQIACKDKNQLPDGIKWRRVFQYEGGEWVPQNGELVPSSLYAYPVTAACMHCASPICLEVCPAAAITKRDDGIVLIDANKCIGCRYCSWACPYGAPQFNTALGVMTKCNMCFDLVDQGQKPACVQACPYRAMDFGPLDELQKAHGTFNAPAPLPDPSITKPSIVYSPNNVTKQTGDKSGSVKNLEEV